MERKIKAAISTFLGRQVDFPFRGKGIAINKIKE
jgi:hypothetical protein